MSTIATSASAPIAAAPIAAAVTGISKPTVMTAMLSSRFPPTTSVATTHVTATRIARPSRWA